MAERVADSNEDKQFSEVKEKDVSESLIPIDEKKVTVDKREEIDSTPTLRRLCCFTYFMKRVSNNAKEFESSEKPPEGFQSIFLCSHLSTILDNNLEADLWLSCLSQISMVEIFVPCINKSLPGKRLASICSLLVDDR